MKYVKNVKDCGIVLSPDKEGSPMYDLDGGGMREAVVTHSGGAYYLNYDGAMPGKTNTSYWNACQAVSTDLTHWEKLGANMLASALTHPESNEKIYKDFRSASSPWSFYEDGIWYHYYVGADHCSPEGIPAFEYSTMLATSEKMSGEWHKKCDENGYEKNVCLKMGRPGTWDDVTTSPGVVLENPKWRPENGEKRYIMIYSGSCSGVTKRSLGIARTDSLGATGAYDDPEGDFWVKDPEPLVSPDEDIENSSVYFDENQGMYYLFTNHIYQNLYTDSVWVYWSKDIEHFSPENKAIVVDKTVSLFAKGAIGMPSVVKKDDNTLAVFYDGTIGTDTGHLDRSIMMAEIKLPIEV